MKTQAHKKLWDMRALLTGAVVSTMLLSFTPTALAVAAEWGVAGNVNERLSGADRFATAAAISQNLATATGGTVVIATGANFPDSLSAAPFAAKLGAPLLLTMPTELPVATRTELRRLAPTQVIIIGSEASISAAVQASLQQLPSTPDVRRIAGDDRFETSARIAAEWGSAVQNAFVVTGTNYPDALSAGPAAAQLGGPVLLVHGEQPQSLAATQEFLDGSGVQRLYIAGSERSVSKNVANALIADSNRTIEKRYSGADRFETSQLIAQSHFSGQVPAVYIATGANYPDALAGAAAAAMQNGPLLLAVQQCIPGGVYSQIDRLRPSKTYALGDEKTLSAAVVQGSECAHPSPSGVTSAEAQASYEIYSHVNAARYAANVPAARLADPERQNAASKWSINMAAAPTKMASLNTKIESQQPWVKREYVQKNPTTSAADSKAAVSHAVQSKSGSAFITYQPSNTRVQIAASWVYRSDIGWLSLYAGV